jgi:hypothetical protein
VLDGALGSRAVERAGWKLVEYPIAELPPEGLLSMGPAHARWASFDPDTARRAAGVGIAPDTMAGLWLEHDDPFALLAQVEQLPASLARFYASEPGVLRELYHLESDPNGLVDVAADHPELVLDLAAALAAAVDQCQAARPVLARDVGEPSADAAALDRLRALGYLGDE